MAFISPFSAITKSDVLTAGGKGASLGEMTNLGIPLPDGFAVLAIAFDRFMSEKALDVKIDEILSHIDHRNTDSVEHASVLIRTLILKSDIPEDISEEIKREHAKLGADYVAVRSSATAEDGAAAAWAGQLESYLNTTADTLLQNVKLCWASLFSPRAIFYRFKNEQHGQKVSVAIVVQRMIDSEASGVSFSVHPVTRDPNMLIIESGFGLGEAVVSGTITPDSFIVHKGNRMIIEKNIGGQKKGLFRKNGGGNEWREIPEEESMRASLSNNEVMQLVDLVMHIEKEYGYPVDIEWAKSGNNFYILQARPITTLRNTGEALNVIDGVEVQLIFTRNMSFWHQCMSALGHYFHTKDFGISAEFLPPFITLHGTQTYVFADPIMVQRYGDDLFASLDDKAKIVSLSKKYETFGRELLESLQLCKEELNSKNWEAFEHQYMRYCAGLTPTAYIGRRGGELLTERLKEIGIPDKEHASIIATISYPAEHTPLFDSQLDLLRIAVDIQKKRLSAEKTDEALHEWLKKYAHIPVNFCDEPWSMQDARLQLETMLLKDCVTLFEEQQSAHTQRIAHTKKRLEEIQDERVSLLSYMLQEATLMNEYRKNIFCRVSLEYRSIFESVAAQCDFADWRDCFYLRPDEMRKAIAGEKFALKDIRTERELLGACVKNGNLIMLDMSVCSRLRRYAELHTGKTNTDQNTETSVRGFSANSGIARGVAKIILHSKDFQKLLPGEILITTMTSVDFVPVMERAAAFVTNEGGITSHASIVAREMNKPCIIGTKTATSMIHDGDMIEVNGDTGVVTILHKNATPHGTPH